ncbi:MAG: hypothetical protein ACT4NP_13130 [Pseudonocardiales bacterium]
MHEADTTGDSRSAGPSFHEPDKPDKPWVVKTVHIAVRTVRSGNGVDQVGRFLQLRHARPVARRGELLDPLDHPALLAQEHGALVGVLTYLPLLPAPRFRAG